jgi:hypothetical protein
MAYTLLLARSCTCIKMQVIKIQSRFEIIIARDEKSTVVWYLYSHNGWKFQHLLIRKEMLRCVSRERFPRVAAVYCFRKARALFARTRLSKSEERTFPFTVIATRSAISTEHGLNSQSLGVFRAYTLLGSLTFLVWFEQASNSHTWHNRGVERFYDTVIEQGSGASWYFILARFLLGIGPFHTTGATLISENMCRCSILELKFNFHKVFDAKKYQIFCLKTNIKTFDYLKKKTTHETLKSKYILETFIWHFNCNYFGTIKSSKQFGSVVLKLSQTCCEFICGPVQIFEWKRNFRIVEPGSAISNT